MDVPAAVGYDEAMGEPAQKIEPHDDQERPLPEQGIEEWFEALPPDDWSNVLDENAFRPVRWVEGVGFVEVST